MYLVNRGANTSAEWTFTADYTIWLSSTTYRNRLIGQHTLNVFDGTASIVRSATGQLTNLATINTRITGMGFQASNVNTGADRVLDVRVYRML